MTFPCERTHRHAVFASGVHPTDLVTDPANATPRMQPEESNAFEEGSQSSTWQVHRGEDDTAAPRQREASGTLLCVRERMTSPRDVLAPVLFAALAVLTLADEAFPEGALAGKAVGAGLLALAASTLPRRTRLSEPGRWLLFPVIALALWASASGLWTVDLYATLLRSRHLGMEALLLVALTWLWTPRRAQAMGLGSALATGILTLGFLLELAAPEGARLRPFGVHPNLQARDIALGSLMAVLLMPRLPGWCAVLLTSVGGFGLGASFSSGAMLAVVCACLPLLPLRRWRPATAGLLVGTLVGAAALTVCADHVPQLRSPATALEGNAIEEIGSGRLVLWGHALRVSAAHPFVGSGAGTFPTAMEPIRVEHQRRGGEHSKPNRRAHNSFLEMLAELGPLGLLLFCLPMFWVGLRALMTRNEVAAALVVFVGVSALTDSLIQQRSLWLGLAVAALSLVRSGQQGSSQPSLPPTS